MGDKLTVRTENGENLRIRSNGAKFNLSFFLWSEVSNINVDEISTWVKHALNTTRMDGGITILLAPPIYEAAVLGASSILKSPEIRNSTTDILTAVKEVRKEKDDIKEFGEYNIVVVGTESDLAVMVDYCNAIYTYGAMGRDTVLKDTPNQIESFELFHDGCDAAYEFQCYRRIFEREFSVESLLSVATCSWYFFPNTTTTCVAINIGDYNVAIGESHAAPSSRYSKELGIRYAKEKAIEEAREKLGSMFAFNQYLGMVRRPILSKYGLWDMADFTELLIKND